MLDKETVEHIHVGREVIYSFLSDVYLSSPRDGFFSTLISLVPSISSMVEDDGSLIFTGVSSANSFVAKRKLLNGEELQSFDKKVSSDYDAIFSSVTLLCGELSNVDRVYSNLNFTPDLAVPSNNLANELKFLTYLSGNAKVFLKNRDDKSYKIVTDCSIDFIQQELIIGVENLVDVLKTSTNAEEFYLPITSLLLGFLKADVVFLKS